MTNKIIVLSGEAGAGKDAVVKILVEYYGWVNVSLAAPLKRFAADMFGFSDEQLYGRSSSRNAPDPRWCRPCNFCTGDDGNGNLKTPGKLGWGSSATDCEACNGTGKLNDNSPRRVLQLLGEEYLRQMIHPDALTMRARQEIEALLDEGCNVVVNDARNDNDRNNLHEWFNAVRVDVRSRRSCAKKLASKEAWRKHASENRQPVDIVGQLEYVIRNDEEWPFPSLHDSVEKMLKGLKGFQH